MNRRGFLTGLTGLIAAPAIIKVAGIMPVKMVDLTPPQVIPVDWIEWIQEGGWMAPEDFNKVLVKRAWATIRWVDGEFYVSRMERYL